jgi:hypothetical protein
VAQGVLLVKSVLDVEVVFQANPLLRLPAPWKSGTDLKTVRSPDRRRSRPPEPL